MSLNKDLLASALETYRYYGGQPMLADVNDCREDSDHGIIQLTSTFSTMDLTKLDDSKFTRSFLYSTKNRQLLSASNITLMNKNILRRKLSSDKKYLALVLSETKGEQELQTVQIWQDDYLMFSYEINDSSKCPHGKILPENDYASFFEWSPDSRRLVFTAEEKRKPVKSYFTAEKLDELGEPASLYRENWGEQMEKFETSVVCIFDLDTKQVKLIENQPKDLYIGQCTWTTNPDELIFVAFRLEPYRLGLIYCENRASALFKCNWRENRWDSLTDFDKLCRLHPRHRPTTPNQFVYLQADVNRGHYQCQRLMLFNSETKEEKILIDRIKNVTYKGENSGLFNAVWDTQFKGIYQPLATRCYSSDGRFLLIRSSSGSRIVLYIYDFNDGNLISLDSPRGTESSISGIAIFGHYVAVNITDFRTPFRLYLFDLRELNNKENGWHSIFEHQYRGEEKQSIETHLDRFFPDGEPIPVESIYVRGVKNNSNRPLMVLVHGGPNSLVPLDFYIGVITYIDLGFDMLIVNYRGSLSFGQDSIEKLLGNISKTDVADCHEAIRRCLEFTNPNRSVVLIGGSHAGVIIGRLIGEYPTEYAAAVLRNPVTDLLHLYAVSDIPDWTLAQTMNEDFQFEDGRNRYTDTKLVNYLIERSSIRLVDKIQTPVLLQLGKRDKRVPFSCGLRYYECLKAKNIPTKLYVYDSNHALRETANASDCFINTILFLDEHLHCFS